MSGESTPAPASGSAGATGKAQNGRDFDVFRLRLGDAIALVAAFALLFIMAGDWYSTITGAEAREIVDRQGTYEPGGGTFDEGAVEDARVEAEQAERNAWQISSVADFLVLVALLATIALAVGAAALRAAGREYPDPRRSPTALAGWAALFALLLVVVQAALRLDPDSNVVIAIGLPLGIGALGALAFGAGWALREERRRAGAGEPAGEGTAASAGAGGVATGRAYNRAP